MSVWTRDHYVEPVGKGLTQGRLAKNQESQERTNNKEQKFS